MTETTSPTRPNVVVVLLDDVGFAAPGTFGGVVDTPALDELAAAGLRYNRFHTTAICSPTRASLMTGRDSHASGVGTVLNSAWNHPAYRGVLRAETATVARMLQLNGYATGCFGKWHLTPAWECSQAGPFDRWPTGLGFDHYYGFIAAETHQWEPSLYEGTKHIDPSDDPDYHLTEDLAAKTIEWIRMQRAVNPDRPFFTYVAPGATHAPLHVPLQWADKYAGRFDQGWDAIREEILARQIESGSVPEGTQLTPRPEEIPAWETLNDDQKKVAARMMEIYAGFLEHTDVQIGKIVTELKEQGIFDNTLFVYIVGDNGGSAEGGPPGSINYSGALFGLGESLEQQLEQFDLMGTRDSYIQYPAGWAWAMSTPLPWVKQIASHLGGIRNPMVLSYPAGVDTPGGVRSQFGHVNDVAPTILDLAGITMPETVDGVAQDPFDGVSLRSTFNDPDAPEQHTMQTFEVFGHRSIYSDGWFASAHHGGLPWMIAFPPEPRSTEDDVWELYNLTDDFSQSSNVADEHPEKLAELQAMFRAEAERMGIWPIVNTMAQRGKAPHPPLSEGRTTFTYYPGAGGMPEAQAPRLALRSWHLKAKVRIDGGDAGGVILSVGGRASGISLWLGQATPRLTYRTFEVDRVELAGSPLSPGEHLVEVIARYHGGGFYKPTDLKLVVDGEVVAEGTISVTPAVFSGHENFDIGTAHGSPVGDHPAHYPFVDAELIRVDLELDG